MNEDSIEAVKATLGRPFEGELPPSAQKLKRNLLALGWVVIFVTVFRIHIENDFTALGVKVVGIDPHILHFGLVLSLLYMLLHFLWAALDALAEWRLRLTGTRVAFVTTGKFADKHGDYPDDPRQSTLYGWWLASIAGRESVSELLTKVEKSLEHCKSLIADSSAINANPNVIAVNQQLSRAAEELFRAKGVVTEFHETLNSKRIPVSLERFDNWFKLARRSASSRWLLFEIVLPLVTGFAALGLLLFT